MSDILPGVAYPLGATIQPDGVNFSVHSKSCSYIELLLFDDVNDHRPSRVIRLNPSTNRSLHYWHVFVRGLSAGQVYAFRAAGPHLPERGLRFDATKVLLDPYGRSVAVPKDYDRAAAKCPGDNTPYAMKSVVVDLTNYDWEGDTPIRRCYSKTVIYEMHVRGFTQHPSSGVSEEARGTYRGILEKIPYLKDLGVTAIELLPVFQFDPQDSPLGLTNYWGYSPVSFFAPHAAYSSVNTPLGALNEFRDMVKALHRAGIEVLLDVVFNHTAEGDHAGPTICFKGLENSAYYILDDRPHERGIDRSRYANYSGCGNTLNGNHSVVRRLILNSLHYWVEQMHVDGFRFDLASVLARDIDGMPQANPPILWDIETDPVLCGTKLIAEAWDAAGLYQVGSFFGDHWKEWNGRFRDDVRSFVKGDRGMAGTFAKRFLGSPDLYEHRQRQPEQSINFVTSHDGFTLSDLVSYSQKHNLANREENRDGHNENLSWNCGAEGPSDDSAIEKLRMQQIKNFFTINILAFGVPMLVMGDEVRRTQHGNNNAYCQDNEIAWMDWSLVEKHAGLYRFVKTLLTYRSRLPDRVDPERSLTDVISLSRLRWHGAQLDKPDWSDDSHSVSLSIETAQRWYRLIFNSYWQPIEYELQPTHHDFSPWHRIIDTALASPEDINLDGIAVPRTPNPTDSMHKYLVQPRSVVVLNSTRRSNL